MRVTLIRNNGDEVTASRVLEALGFTIADDGTYIVYTAEGLLAWATEAQSNPSLNCTLADDITMPEAAEGDSNWTPIPKFAGTFDGNGKTITGLTINQSATDNVGLFASIKVEGTVKNLKLDKVNVTANSNVGAIAGENRGTIENCSVSGNVTSHASYNSGNIGGIVGQNNGTITSCTTEGSVKVENGMWAGGIAGSHSKGSITDCHSSATVKGKAAVGGIAGHSSAALSNASIIACYSTGSVTATELNSYSYAGGIVGENSSGAILTACYATGDVKGDGRYVGGVVGENVYSTVIACYHATGSVTGASGSTGGVVGRNFQYTGYSSIITACYWNNNQGSGIGEDLTNNGETTKVTSGDWTEAMNAMNMALTNAGTDWRYATGSGDIPLTLYKQ